MAAVSTHPSSQKVHASSQVNLPSDIIFKAFTCLTVLDLCQVSRTCRSFYQTSKIVTLWQKLYCKIYYLPQFPQNVDLRGETMMLCSFVKKICTKDAARVQGNFKYKNGFPKILGINTLGSFVSIFNHGIVQKCDLLNLNQNSSIVLSIYKGGENFVTHSIYKSDLFAKNLLVAARRPSSLEIWEVDNRREIARMETIQGEVLAWDLHATTLTYSVRHQEQNSLCEWDYAKNEVRTIIQTENPINSLKYLRTGEYAVVFSNSMQLCTLGENGWALSPCLERRHTSFARIRDVEISGDYISFISPFNFEIWNYRTQRMVTNLFGTVCFQRVGELIFTMRNSPRGTELSALRFPEMQPLKTAIISPLTAAHQYGSLCIDIKNSRVFYLQAGLDDNPATFAVTAWLFNF